MITVHCHNNPSAVGPQSRNYVPVVLFGKRTTSNYVIGNQLLDRVSRLGVPVSQTSFDFLTLSLAATAADTFILRSKADDGWTREFKLIVHLGNAEPWLNVICDIEKALHFLSGDIWKLDIRDGGYKSPTPYSKRYKLIELGNRDCVCLFSGGLDSAIGALDLIAEGHKPILVSHAYRGDKEYQDKVSSSLTRSAYSRFVAHASPFSPSGVIHDTTMRTRSLNFLAFGAVVVSALSAFHRLSAVNLFVPENGMISINAPLTDRRIGALSTRTTHPYFIQILQGIFSKLGIEAQIENPYKFATKGEMLKFCKNTSTLRTIAPQTVSCGKWKRTGYQCGRCVPCLIRRASFHSANINDSTTPSYRFPNLSHVLNFESERDDLLALLLAVKKKSKMDRRILSSWIASNGPLPADPSLRANHIDTFVRGLSEAEKYFKTIGLLS